jgi:methionine sulfoxide reductase heme-binding subunit
MTSNKSTSKNASQRRTERRLLSHHLPLALASLVLIAIFFQLVASPDLRFRLSMATAYTALILLGGTLLTGPINVLKSRPNPISTDLRRDLGIWSAIIGIVHTAVGLTVHMSGKFWLYFVYSANETHLLPIRFDFFGFANYTGLIATLILAFLLALSNDLSIRILGGKCWKNLQRWNYGLYVLVVLHASTYQLVEKRQLPYPILFALLVVVVIVIQWAGFRRRKRQLTQTMNPDT